MRIQNKFAAILLKKMISRTLLELLVFNKGIQAWRKKKEAENPILIRFVPNLALLISHLTIEVLALMEMTNLSLFCS